MSKRVFEIARELDVKSKALIEKCKAEGVPGITNHMSSVSAGLEATLHSWFSAADAEVGVAVETAEKVDLTKVRAKPRKKTARKAAAPNAATTATIEAPPESVETEAPPAAPAPTPEQPAPVEPPAKVAEAPAAPTATMKVGPGQPAPMNVPTRPTEVKPVGPKLDVQKPAKLSGPKVIRVEAPDVIENRRRREPSGPSMPMSRGPRGGGGVNMPDAPPSDSADRRNKRRTPGGTGAGPGARDKGAKRSARGGGAGAGSGKTWRQQDLIEREARLNRSGGFLSQRRRDQKIKSRSPHERAATAAQTGGTVKIASPFSIKDLSAATGVRSAEIVKKLFLEGTPATPTAILDDEKAMEIMLEYNIELEIETEATAEEIVVQEFEQRETINEQPRFPVVTILGHVDHGKTSLLDKIRKADVASGEAGGITQATSAFLVPVSVAEGDRKVCFLDTPGHEAFTEMRSRGANMTDIVVLVVAADDGVMPQTVESIAHAQAAGVPVVVALNKTDLPNATDENVQKILGQLAEKGLNPTEWGGETEVIRTSAQTGAGIDDLLETLDLQAQLLELTADFSGNASGMVIESRLEEGRGAVANILIQQGEIKVGDNIAVGRAFGRVRDITDDRGNKIKVATPSTPIQISGINEIPDAGDKFYIVKNLKKAQEAAEHRYQEERERKLVQPKATLDAMFAQMSEAKVKELLVVLKADVQGSVDVIKNAVEDIATDEVKIRVLHAAVGGVSDSDVTLAAASGAIILGFNVIPSSKARRNADAKGVEVRAYRVIYDIVDDIKMAAEGLLEPEVREEILGHAEVRKVFKVSKIGAIAGCYVTDGSIERNALIRVTRDDIVIEHDRVLEQLKRFKDDAKDVKSGQECGMKIVGYDDIKEGDILECYRKTEVKRTL